MTWIADRIKVWAENDEDFQDVLEWFVEEIKEKIQTGMVRPDPNSTTQFEPFINQSSIDEIFK